MDGTFVRELYQAIRQPTKMVVGGEEYLVTPKGDGFEIQGGKMGWGEERNYLPCPMPEPIRLHTLAALIEYVMSRYENDRDKLLIHIVTPLRVRVTGEIRGGLRQRPVLVEASLDSTKTFPFDLFVDPEDFIVHLKTRIKPSVDREYLLELVSGLHQQQTLTMADDGVSQTATVKRGIELLDKKVVRSDLNLHPRSMGFAEKGLEYPPLFCVFRLQAGPKCGLFSASSTEWTAEACGVIAAWIKAQVGDAAVVIG
jgi:hypothetical protein